MKYGYRFMDWGLFEIDELEEVEDLTEDKIIKDCFGTHTFEKDKWCQVKCTKPIFLVNNRYNGKYFTHDESCEGLYYKEHIFNTREEAENYGRENSSLNFY